MSASLSPVAEIGWSPDLSVTSADGACESVLGRSQQALIGRPLHEALGVSAPVASRLAQRAKGPSVNLEFVRSNRGAKPVLRLSLGAVDGEPRAAVLDFTALLVGAPPLQIAALSSSLSHEIRNPLSSVKMAVQTVVKNPALSDRDRRRLVIANREIRTIERMLGMLSEYGRDLPLMMEPLSARAVVQEALSLVEPELTERQIRVDIDEQPDLPRVLIDAPRLRLVLAQTFLNVALGLEDGQSLPVRLRREKQAVRVELTDPGVPGSDEEQAKLFEPFGTWLARGARLSLATLRQVMQLHGGEVKAAPGAGGGTLFSLSFPT